MLYGLIRALMGIPQTSRTRPAAYPAGLHLQTISSDKTLLSAVFESSPLEFGLSSSFWRGQRLSPPGDRRPPYCHVRPPDVMESFRRHFLRSNESTHS